MFLSVDCSSPIDSAFLYPVKGLLTIIMIISPILLIINFVYTLILMMQNPDDKKLPKRLLNGSMALVIIFFIPLLVNLVFMLVDENVDLASCWNNSTAFGKPTYISIDGEENKRKKIIKEEKYEKGVPRQLKFNYKGDGSVKSQFSDETMKIVEKHVNDFNYNNYNSFMSNYGGADKYIKDLGGVFSKYYGGNKKVTSAYEFQQVSEYVFGLMYIYGFDYYSGSKYCKWGGSCDSGSSGASDAFYPGTYNHTKDGLSDNRTNFDSLITAKNEINMTTNCNWTVDMVYTKAGIYSNGYGTHYKDQCTKGKNIKSITDLKVGDIVHFFKGSVNRDTLSASGWYHVAYIGEVYDDKVVGYDGGSYFTNGRNFKWEASKSGDKMHGTSNWIACRIVDLK